MRILVYKRTHIGDPDREGRFGINGCMGSIRALEYDAVIGIGALTPEARSHGIHGRINWIGIGPQKDWGSAAMKIDSRGPQVRFRRFGLWENAGPLLRTEAPMLARRFYEGRARYVVAGFTPAEQREAESILGLIGKHQSASSHQAVRCKPKKTKGNCPPRRRC